MIKTKQIILIFILSIMSLASQPYSYDYQYNDGAGNRTQLLSNVGCNVFCGCPEDKDDWFTLTSAAGGSGSSCPNGCIVSYTLNIPAEYDCYNYYKIKSGEDLSNYSLLNGGTLQGIPNCIPKDNSWYLIRTFFMEQ